MSETKPCPICAWPVPAGAIRRVTCSMACRRLWQQRQMKGRSMAVATAGRLAACKQRVEDAARGQFGVLSDRERALFNFAAKVGYRRGYFANHPRWKRKVIAA